MTRIIAFYRWLAGHAVTFALGFWGGCFFAGLAIGTGAIASH